MCFTNEPDWHASVTDMSSAPAKEPGRCDECRAPIAVGEMLHHIYMQEWEYCRDCEQEDCECGHDDKCCTCPEPDIGETFSWDCCDDCHKLLDAISKAEIAAGCRLNESRPMLTAMHEELHEIGMDGCKRYWKHAAKLYPELVSSGWLGRMWRKLFC